MKFRSRLNKFFWLGHDLQTDCKLQIEHSKARTID